MSVRKFLSVGDMPGPAPLPPLDPENLRLACAWSQLALRLHPIRLRPGVRKFRSAEEAFRARDEESGG